MINITITPNRITASGHAMFAPKGCDIVCASVSTALVLLAESISAWERKGYLDGNSIELQEGCADIRFLAIPPMQEALEAQFTVFCSFLRELAKEYTDHICVIGNAL